MTNCRNPKLDRIIGMNIRTGRECARVSAESLAIAIKVPQKRLLQFESGEERVPASVLMEISYVLNLPLANFFTGIEESMLPKNID